MNVKKKKKKIARKDNKKKLRLNIFISRIKKSNDQKIIFSLVSSA